MLLGMNKVKKSFLHQAGFTLVETLLAIGISTGAAMIVYKVLGESQKGQIMVENRDDINQFHREIIGKFTDRVTCTLTLKKDIEKGLDNFPIKKIVKVNDTTLLEIPYKQGKITLSELNVVSVDKEKNVALIDAKYLHTIAAKTITAQKQFRLELSYKDNAFEGCIARGTLGLDPKDACDLVVGSDAQGSSYFYNGKCNFAEAACEQSGRVWNVEGMKCNFSEDDLEALRKEICTTIGYEYSPETNMCLPSQALLDMIENLKKQQK